MFISLTLILIILTLILISQFGGKLSAQNSLVWWLIFAFLIFVTTHPDGLLPLTHFLGITLVSNFVFAAMILFLIFQAIQESAVSTGQQRKLRSVVTKIAADYFLQKNEWPSKRKPRVLIVFPCYNEAENLPDLFQHIAKLAPSPFELFPCIINDGSTDESESILKLKAPHISTHHVTNVGVAGVLLTGFKIAKTIDADFLVQCDSDGQHPLEKISDLVEQAIQKNADLMIGSRYVNSSALNIHESSSPLRKVGSLIIRLSLKLFSLQNTVTDPTSGFRVYSKNAFRALEPIMPDEYPEPETIAILFSKKFRVMETPIPMSPRQAGESSLGGLKGIQFMLKVVTALIGLRLRTWIKNP